MRPGVVGGALLAGALFAASLLALRDPASTAIQVSRRERLPEHRAEQGRNAPIARSAEAASAPITTPINTDHERDLYRQAVRMADTSDRLSLSYGLMLTQVCGGAVDVQTEPALRLSQPGRTPESLAAHTKLQHLCRGFANNDAAANAGLQASFFSKLRALQSRYVAGVSTGAATPEQIKNVIAEGDWYTFDLLLSDVMPRLLAARSIDPNSEAALTFGVAYMQAACSLGKDCSADGVVYLAFCSQQAICRGSLQENLSEGLTPQQRAAADKARAEIASAFRRRDVAYFIGPSAR